MVKKLGCLIALVLAAACDRQLPQPDLLTGGDAKRGKELIAYYGCGSCHEIGGIPGANATVAPSLKDLRKRVYLAGRLANDPRSLERWIVDPRAIDPKTAMPKVGVDEAGARDIAAYLYNQ